MSNQWGSCILMSVSCLVFCWRCKHSEKTFNGYICWKKVFQRVFQSFEIPLNFCLYFILKLDVIFIHEPFLEIEKSIDIFLSHTLQRIDQFSLKSRQFTFGFKNVSVSPCYDRFVSFILLSISTKYANLYIQFWTFETFASLATSAFNS